MLGFARQQSILFIAEYRQHQQDGIGALMGRQLNLIRRNKKVFAQYRLFDSGTHLGQIAKVTLKEGLVCQYRHRGGVAAVNIGNGNRIEVFADKPFGGAGLLAFQNKAGAFCTECLIQAAIRRLGRQALFGKTQLEGFNMLLLGGDDTLKHVTHDIAPALLGCGELASLFSVWVWWALSTRALSLAQARPSSRVARASWVACLRLSALPAR